jgi:helix-turn-helix protein
VEKEEAEIGIEAIFNKYWKDLHLIEVNFKILLVINKLHVIFINKFEHGGCIMLNEQCEKNNLSSANCSAVAKISCKSFNRKTCTASQQNTNDHYLRGFFF